MFNEQFGFLHANKDIVGKEMIRKAFAPNFWRAKNYNDRLGWRPTVHNGFWKDADKKLKDTSVDGTHPGDYGYTLWARSIQKPLLKILKKYGIE